MTFTNVRENLITVWNVNQAVAWVSTALNDAEEVWNWGKQIESKQPFFFAVDLLVSSLVLAKDETKLHVW